MKFPKADYRNCTKRFPSMCRLHKNSYAEYRKLAEQVLQQEKTNKLKEQHVKLLANLKLNLKPSKDSEGNPVVSVYRSGITSAPKERGIEKEGYQLADKYLPEGRQGRMTGIFASPSVNGVTRWVGGNALAYSSDTDIQVRELRVNPDEVYVYSVPAWEAATRTMDNYPEQEGEAMTAYWQTGITLSDWLEKAKTDHTLQHGEWELLLPESAIKRSSNVGIKRVQNSALDEYDHRTVGRELTKNKKELEWRKTLPSYSK